MIDDIKNFAAADEAAVMALYAAAEALRRRSPRLHRVSCRAAVARAGRPERRLARMVALMDDSRYSFALWRIRGEYSLRHIEGQDRPPMAIPARRLLSDIDSADRASLAREMSIYADRIIMGLES